MNLTGHPLGRTGPLRTGRGVANGFTLLEILVVMLLLTIMVGVAAPRISSGLFVDPTEKVTRFLIHAVRQGREAAVKTQQIWQLVIDMGHEKVWLESTDMNDDALAGAAEKAFVLPGSVRIAAVTPTGGEATTSGTARITFYPAGYSDQVIIQLQNSDDERLALAVEPFIPKTRIIEDDGRL